MIARVFPSKTSATPADALAFVGEPKALIPGLKAVHVSVTFSWDIPEARRLANLWESVQRVPTHIGGPALGDAGNRFVPGMYLKPGYVLTSRGCPNNCWFCVVPKREGPIRELPVADGFNILDSNFLATSSEHQARVFGMLSRQKRRPVFSGGLEARLLTASMALRLRQIGTERLYCAYDTPDDLEPLREAGKILQAVGFSKKHHLFAYVLMGFPRDTEDDFLRRKDETWAAGFMPMAMRWRDPNQPDWEKLARKWARPAYMRRNLP